MQHWMNEREKEVKEEQYVWMEGGELALVAGENQQERFFSPNLFLISSSS